MKITPEIVRELLHYDPETGIFTWRGRDDRWFRRTQDRKTWNSKYSQKRAGHIDTDVNSGYQRRVLSLFDRPHLEHHLAWLYMKGEPLPAQLDHRNRDATDNRWCNLRSSSSSDNNRNVSMRRTNTSGVTGVHWNKKDRKWCARCTVNGKYHNLGNFEHLRDAAQAVETFRAAHGFDPNHGKELAHYI